MTNPSILTINGGSSSIKFALYQAAEPLKRGLHGMIDRVGMSGTNLTFNEPDTNQRDNPKLAPDDKLAASFLMDWLQKQEGFESVQAVGHRVVHGMQHTAPSLVTRELLDELHRVSPCAIDGKPAGILAVADPIKSTAAEAIVELHSLGLQFVMLTGDNRRTADAVAKKLGLDAVEAEIDPAGKIAQIKKLRAAGKHVAMAGDGINDAPALSEAEVGIAMGTGTDVAMQSAGVTLVKGDLRGIAKAIRLSRATMRNIRENLFFAFLYNALGIPLAAGVLYPFFGLLLSPMIAGAAMSLSSVSVIANALRLRKVRL
jgi:cation transport ATPase